MLSNSFITRLENVHKVGAQTMSQAGNKYFPEFDLQVKVVQLSKLDEYTKEARVIDESKQIWHCSLLSMKYRYVREGQFIRVRGATLANHSKYSNTFGLKPSSNIMTLPYPCMLAQKMELNPQVKYDFEKSTFAQKDVIMHPVIVSAV